MIKQAIRIYALVATVAFFLGTGAAATPFPLPDASSPRRTAATVKAIREVLATPSDKIDLAKAELTFEKLVDPNINTDILLGQIERMAQSVRIMAEPHASGAERLAALKTYIYQPGPWNDFKPYGYDFTDPYGRDYTHALVSRYLVTRQGNCVSMPFLFVMLGNRLGLKMTLAMVTRHIFVKYTDDAEKTVNLETTSGANPARDVWLRQVTPMSDRAVASGAYMAPLTRSEALAVMAGVMLEAGHARHRYAEMAAVTDLLLRAYPKFVQAMVIQSGAYEDMIDTEFGAKYATPELIPSGKRARYFALARKDRAVLDRVTALGWRESDYRPRAVEAPTPVTLATSLVKGE
ncbi:MAG TPA: transglutaminase family protein [Rhizomicrobium sp.]|nr:transglutaminase family protein [Rhizomicrobium sp.]